MKFHFFFLLLAVGGVALAGGAFVSSRPQPQRSVVSELPMQPASRSPNQSTPPAQPVQMKWEDYVRLARLLEDLPAWTTDAPSTPEQWRPTVQMGAAFQQLPIEDVQRILILYMAQHPDPFAYDKPHPWTRIRLLGAVLYNLPEDELDNTTRGELATHGISATGGPFAPASLEEAGERPPLTLASPVHWDENKGPILIAGINRGVLFAGGTYGLYEPHIEFAYFREHFGHRDLRPVLGEHLPTWLDLLRQFNENARSRALEEGGG